MVITVPIVSAPKITIFFLLKAMPAKAADKSSDISRSAALKAQLTYNSQGFLDYSTKQSINSMFSELI